MGKNALQPKKKDKKESKQSPLAKPYVSIRYIRKLK